MDHYSYTKLDTYAGCPLRFKRKYIEKLPEALSEALERGIAVHEIVAAYVKHCLENGVQTDLDYLRSVQGTDEVMEILETYASTHLIEPGDYTIEEMWKVPLGPWTFWGKVDQLKADDGAVVITDLKTDHKIRSQTDIDKDPQLRTYAWMASLKYPLAQEFHCAIDFVRYGVTRETTYTREDMPAIEKRISSQIEEIEADRKYEAVPGLTCGYCSYTDRCPAVTHGGGIEVIASADDAGRAAAELIALKARVKSIEDLLKPWTSTNGAIEVNGMEAGFFKTESFEYPDLDELAEALYGAGFDPTGFLKADTTKLKAAAKKDPTLAKSLEVIAIDKSTTRFTTRKAKGEAA